MSGNKPFVVFLAYVAIDSVHHRKKSTEDNERESRRMEAGGSKVRSIEPRTGNALDRSERAAAPRAVAALISL